MIQNRFLVEIIEVVIKNYVAIRASGMTATEAVKDLIAACQIVAKSVTEPKD